MLNIKRYYYHCGFRRAMTVVGPLQIVPDMEDACVQSADKTRVSSPGSSAPSDLEIKLHQLQSDSVHHDWQPKSALARKRVGSSQTLIKRVNTDAQPLNAVELITHRHIIHQPRSWFGDKNSSQSPSVETWTHNPWTQSSSSLTDTLYISQEVDLVIRTRHKVHQSKHGHTTLERSRAHHSQTHYTSAKKLIWW